MPPRDPQAVRFAESDSGKGFTRAAFTDWLVDTLRDAIDARAKYIADGGYIDVWHGLYEQAERPAHARPWPDAADLASYIPTEKIDALRARLVQTVFGTDPICTVEGWGEPAERVAKAEAFHQWKAEDERLQTWVAKALHMGLIEGNGILEVDERHGFKKTRGPFRAAVRTDEWKRPILDEDLQPIPAFEGGKVVPWSGRDDEGYMDIQREVVDYVGRGPQYRVLSLKDFLYLPGHANDMSEVWGFAKRVHVRVGDLEQRVAQGVYDRDAVAKLGTDMERQPRPEHARAGVTVVQTEGRQAEKELWEVHLLIDIDGDGIDEWLIATISLTHTELLRCAFDDVEQVRFVSFVPYPRATSVYGYSFLGHKLWTIAEEHTALRNMKADRQALALNAPILRTSTSIWNPEDQPFGVGAVIDVRSLDEIKQLTVQDVPTSTYQSEQTIFGAAERVTGLNDVSVSGVQPTQDTTATEIRTAGMASAVRVDEPIRYVQEALEDLYILRNRLWARALAHDDDGAQPPERVLVGLQSRGIELPQRGAFRFTAQDLEGSFKFKPKGSVETADKGRLRQDYAEFLSKALPTLIKLFPAQGQQILANPDAFRELLAQGLRLYGFTAMQAILRQSPQIAAPEGVLPTGAPGALPPGAMPPMLAQALPGLMASLRGAPAAPPAPVGVLG